jgi:hypothetical protein
LAPVPREELSCHFCQSLKDCNDDWAWLARFSRDCSQQLLVESAIKSQRLKDEALTAAATSTDQ